MIAMRLAIPSRASLCAVQLEYSNAGGAKVRKAFNCVKTVAHAHTLPSVKPGTDAYSEALRKD